MQWPRSVQHDPAVLQDLIRMLHVASLKPECQNITNYTTIATTTHTPQKKKKKKAKIRKQSKNKNKYTHITKAKQKNKTKKKKNIKKLIDIILI